MWRAREVLGDVEGWALLKTVVGFEAPVHCTRDLPSKTRPRDSPDSGHNTHEASPKCV